ncbi:bifunctional tetrahydrofolate synthase/dihydrofolate synthase [Stutzerimonas azotifigens]|uniref:bifunctional tetrahydrofolate synthase/dihydrofolate synthase n=1 Tax=Stutzerimonas azotifigens TaxID=291995 RepID=UPI0003F76BA2|nr:bifunctional tetrahydrofolate synthase/dihydrofolate synthase [Stutzerimonas azotifigens]
MTRRSLAQWLAYLEQLHPKAIDLGLERSGEVFARLGLTRPAPRVVTVTGTNGKGSTCAFVASLLAEQDLRVGVYSSPHLLRYNERVAIDGVPVDDDALCEAFEAVEAARGAISLTYFEMGTLAAFWLFERAALDAVVLEVGLGGRLDAVNLVDADVAVVTNIGLDHAEWLGSDRDSVAREKAGIFRRGRPAVCGDLDPPAALLAAAETLQVPLDRRGHDYDLSPTADGWRWRGHSGDGRALVLEGLPLLRLPVENAALALQAVARLGVGLSREQASAALTRTTMVGRLDRRSLEWRGRRVSLLLDVAHNPHAARFLADHLRRQAPAGRRLAVFGLLEDKDLQGILDNLGPLVDAWAVTPLATPRSRGADELFKALKGRGANVVACDTVRQALDVQCEACAENDELLVFGSFFCVAECLEWLNRA